MNTKTIVIAVALALATVVSGNAETDRSSLAPKAGWLRRTFCKLTWDEFRGVAQKPKDVCRRVERAVRYNAAGAMDVDPQQIWSGRRGDHMDIAECIVAMCREKDFNAKVVIFSEDSGGTMQEANAVVVGVWNGKHWMAVNGRFYRVASVEDGKRLVRKALAWSNEVSVNGWPTLDRTSIDFCTLFPRATD